MLGKICSGFDSVTSVPKWTGCVAFFAVTRSPFCRYLYFEYNEIREVDPGTFDSMPSLQLLFLNANLLRSLPPGVFSGLNLARLNLRNNHFLQLPVAGVLEHLTGLVKVGAQPVFSRGWGWTEGLICQCWAPGQTGTNDRSEDY